MWNNGHDAYLESRVLSADPLELVHLLYQAAIQAVRDAREHLDRGEIGERSRAINKTCEILMELGSSLDRERGAEIAERLARLYDYMLGRLLEANMQQSDAPLAEVLALLTTLSEAWDGVRQPTAAPAASWAAPAAEPPAPAPLPAEPESNPWSYAAYSTQAPFAPPSPAPEPAPYIWACQTVPETAPPPSPAPEPAPYIWAYQTVPDAARETAAPAPAASAWAYPAAPEPEPAPAPAPAANIWAQEAAREAYAAHGWSL